MGGHKKAHESAWSLLAVLLSLAMIFAGFPTAALAEAAEELNPAPIEENADGTPSQEEESSQPAQSPQELATSTRDELTDSGLAAKAAAKVSATAPSDAQGTELVKALFEGTLDALASNADDSALGQAYGDSPDAAIVAGAFAAIVEELGLKCAIVADGTEDVLWDLVEVDGLWYHVDAWSAHVESHEGGSAETSVEDLENAWLLVGDDAITTRDNARRLSGKALILPYSQQLLLPTRGMPRRPPRRARMTTRPPRPQRSPRAPSHSHRTRRRTQETPLSWCRRTMHRTWQVARGEHAAGRSPRTESSSSIPVQARATARLGETCRATHTPKSKAFALRRRERTRS